MPEELQRLSGGGPRECGVGLGVLCFYFCAIMLLLIMPSEFEILERDYATYMLA